MVRIWDLVLQFEVFGYLVGLSEDDLSTQSCKKGHNRTAVRWIGRVQIEIGPKSVILHSQMLHGAGIFTYIFIYPKNGTNVGKYSSTMEHLGFGGLLMFVSGILSGLLLQFDCRVSIRLVQF